MRCHVPTWAGGGGKAREGQGPKRTLSPKPLVVAVGSKPRILLLFSLWFFMFLLKDRHQLSPGSSLGSFGPWRLAQRSLVCPAQSIRQP